jgi:hypothetical protein
MPLNQSYFQPPPPGYGPNATFTQRQYGQAAAMEQSFKEPAPKPPGKWQGPAKPKRYNDSPPRLFETGNYNKMKVTPGS